VSLFTCYEPGGILTQVVKITHTSTAVERAEKNEGVISGDASGKE
jgi:hypothetical protein